jgi:hypothetical protein
MFADRRKRVRVLQEIERTVRQFRTRHDLWPLRAPNAPLSLDDLVERTLEAAHFDPLTLRARTLLWLQWDSGDTWELWIIALPSGLKLYCDTGGGETRMLATGRRDSEIETDRLFLELLSESAGGHFGIEMAGGPPASVRSPLDDRALIAEFFVNRTVTRTSAPTSNCGSSTRASGLPPQSHDRELALRARRADRAPILEIKA